MSDFSAVASKASYAAKVTKVAGVIGAATAMVAGVADAAAGFIEGDGHRVAKSSGATAGGMLGAFAGGVVAGAATGFIFGGVGSIPGAVIGGLVSAGGALLGSHYGAEAVDYVLGDGLHNSETFQKKRADLAVTSTNAPAVATQHTASTQKGQSGPEVSLSTQQTGLLHQIQNVLRGVGVSFDNSNSSVLTAGTATPQKAAQTR